MINIKKYATLYLHKEIIWIFVNGIASGFPWVVIGSVMTLWLRESGYSRSAIGYFGSIFAVYAINFIWAPFVDALKIPWLHNLGQRRSWIIVTQLVMCLGIIGLTQVNLDQQLMFASIFALGIAIASATQDIAIDAYRIDILAIRGAELQAAGAAAATSGWWTGYTLLGAFALFVADIDGVSWQHTLLLLAGFVVILMFFTIYIIREPVVDRTLTTMLQHPDQATVLQRFSAYILAVVVAPIRDFFLRYKTLALAIFAYILLFKIGEAFLGRMSLVFYSDIGFSKTEIGAYSKLMTWWVTIIVSIAAGGLVAHFGLARGLLISGIAMAATNLLFALMAVVGPEAWVFILTVLLDGITSACSTVAFVAFISYLTSTKFSATQYALMASLGNLSRTLLSSTSGELIDSYLGGSWVIFFVLTTVMAIPGLVLLAYIASKLGLWDKRQQPQQ